MIKFTQSAINKITETHNLFLPKKFTVRLCICEKFRAECQDVVFFEYCERHIGIGGDHLENFPDNVYKIFGFSIIIDSYLFELIDGKTVDLIFVWDPITGGCQPLLHFF